MARIIAAVCLLIMSVGGAEVTRIVSDKQVEKLMAGLERIEINVDDREELERAAGDLHEKWESASKTFSFYLDHRHFDKVGETVARVRAYAKRPEANPADVMAECANLRFLLDHIRGLSRMTAENIV
ncbi:MAG: DUF4363 family protein [Oscillospiraceae bacterium]|nr:DUF4363 family protein [Oscillospiraceae bacterium]